MALVPLGEAREDRKNSDLRRGKHEFAESKIRQFLLLFGDICKKFYQLKISVFQQLGKLCVTHAVLLDKFVHFFCKIIALQNLLERASHGLPCRARRAAFTPR